jgi:hypothetical protein
VAAFELVTAEGSDTRTGFLLSEAIRFFLKQGNLEIPTFVFSGYYCGVVKGKNLS